MKIKIGIVGYGNLGKGVECSIQQNEDMELVGIFTRRDPKHIEALTSAPCFIMGELLDYKEKIDVLILCGGSANDLPLQSVALAKDFNVIDSYDTHAKIPEHFENVDQASKFGKKISIISVGWDPGLFSLNRLYGQAILPEGSDYTFWGKGVSQGHSDAIRKISGVVDARQYTIPMEEAMKRVRDGELPQLSTSEKHIRECFVVVEKQGNKQEIEQQIVTMPNYFADYKTIVNFISEEELKEKHSGIPHGGVVLRSGKTGVDCKNNQLIEYKLELDSNPEFTSSVLVAYARAAYRLANEGQIGCKTVFDIAPGYLHKDSAKELRKKLL